MSTTVPKAPTGAVPAIGVPDSQDYPRLVYTAPYFAQTPLAELIEPSVIEAAEAVLPELVPPYVQGAADAAVDQRAVLLTGSTMSGPLFLNPAIPTQPSQAASMAYVDMLVSTGPVPEVPAVPFGQTWARQTGQWVPSLSDAPNDGTAYGRLSQAWSRVLPITGGALTGQLTLAADPAVPLGAATMQYVDGAVNRAGGPFLPLATGGTVAGATTFSATGTALSVTAGAVIVGTNAGAATNISLVSAAGQTRYLQWFSGGVGGGNRRWQLGADNTAEGANAGSLLKLAAFDDSGTFLGNPLVITRPGLASFTGGVTVTVNYPVIPQVGNAFVGFSVSSPTDSVVVPSSNQFVWWSQVGGNVGALAWAPSTAYALSAQRNNGGRIYTVTTAGTSAASGGPTGTGTGITDGSVVWNYVSSDFVGSRSAFQSTLNVRSRNGAGATSDLYRNFVATGATFQASANQGGTAPSAGNSAGNAYASGLQSWLFAGATNWSSVVGQEIDVAIFTGASAKSRLGLNVVSFGNLRGAVDDTAISIGSNSASPGWGDAIGFGEAALNGGNSIMCYRPRPQGALAGATYTNPIVDRGIDLQNINFTTVAIRTPGNGGFSPAGYVLSGAAQLSTSSTAVSLDALGSIVTAAAFAAGASGFKIGDTLYDPGGTGTLLTINTVDGSGMPLTWTITRAGGTLTTPPANPVAFWGGSGINSNVNLTWTRVSTLSLNPSGGPISFGGSVASPFFVSGPVATNRSMTLQTSGGNRWSMTAEATNEGGANAGSNFSLIRYDDSGASLGNPIFISRATGLVQCNNGATINGTFTVSGTVSVQIIGGGGQGFINSVGGPLTLQSAANANITLTPGGTGQIVASSPLRMNGTVGFNNTAPIAKPTVSGAKGSNAALASLMTALVAYGLVVDSTSA